MQKLEKGAGKSNQQRCGTMTLEQKTNPEKNVAFLNRRKTNSLSV